MLSKCAGCGGEVTRLENNFGEFWYGITLDGRFSTQFSVADSDDTFAILGHHKLYFCPDCQRNAQLNCIEAQNALDQFAIALRSPNQAAEYRYFTRKDFAELKFR